MEKPLELMTLEELWQLFPIKLCEPNPDWAVWFQEERQALEALLGGHAMRIRHIGSTAISGIPAKPTVDILLEISGDTDLAWLENTMLGHGYSVNHVPAKPPPHLVFLKGYTPWGFAGRVFHIHIRYRGDWEEIRFRDYLNAHPEARQQYAALKRSLLKDYTHDRDGYTDAKGAFVRQIDALAKKEST